MSDTLVYRSPLELGRALKPSLQALLLATVAAFGLTSAALVNGSLSISRAILIGIAIFAVASAGALLTRPISGGHRLTSETQIAAAISSLVALLCLVTSLSNDERGRVVTAATAVGIATLIWILAIAVTDERATFEFGLAGLAVLTIAPALFMLPFGIDGDVSSESASLLVAALAPLTATLLIDRDARRSIVIVGMLAIAIDVLTRRPDSLAISAIAGSICALLYIADQTRPTVERRAAPVTGSVDSLFVAGAIGFLGVFLAVSMDQPVRGLLAGSIASLVAAVAMTQRIVIAVHQRQMQELERTAIRIREHAQLDGLTGLPNRAALDDRLAEEVERAVRYRQPLSVLFVDVDHFKQINDTLGHQTGDQALREFAAVLRSTIRTPDFVARYGGEEFVVIAPGTWTGDAVVLGNRIRAATSIRVAEFLGRPVTLSIGIAGVPEHGLDADGILGVADLALYAAKAGGRDRIEIGFVQAPLPTPG